MKYREITESMDVVRIGIKYIRRLKSRSHLLVLLNRTPSMRGWLTINKELWVWNAEDFSHDFVQFKLPYNNVSPPLYFWHKTKAPDSDFEQNDGRDVVMDCGDFYFDFWITSSYFDPLIDNEKYREQKTEELQKLLIGYPILANIIQ